MATIRKLKSGNYQVQIRLSGLKPITKSFPQKTLAIKFAREVEGNTKLQHSLGLPIKNKITFSEVVAIYLKQYTGRDPSTFGRLRFWTNLFGDDPIMNVTEFIIDDGLHFLSSGGRTGSTVNRYKSTLSAVFIFFVKHPIYKKLGLTNPVRRESVSTFTENPAKERFLSDSEQKSILYYAKNSSWDKLYLLILLGLTTGARKGELLGLKWSDIDFEQRFARLHKFKTKSGKPRLLPLTVPVINELKKYRGIGDCLIFNNTVGTGFAYEIKRPWSNVLLQSKIKNFRFHDLRHTAASNLARNGATLLEIADVLGHSSTIITQRYAHLCINHKADLVNRIMGNLGD